MRKIRLIDTTLRDGMHAVSHQLTPAQMAGVAKGLDEAQAKGLITRDLGRVVPTERGFDFLSDLQEMFL